MNKNKKHTYSKPFDVIIYYSNYSTTTRARSSLCRLLPRTGCTQRVCEETRRYARPMKALQEKKKVVQNQEPHPSPLKFSLPTKDTALGENFNTRSGTMAEVCDGYCCIAKRFDRPFRLPQGSRLPPPPGAPASSSSSLLIRPDSSNALLLPPLRSRSREELTEDAPSVHHIELEGAANPPADDDEESKEEDAAARARLREILDAVVAEAAAGALTTSSSGGGDGALRVFVKQHLGVLAHLSHRRELHCRVILQHAAADRVVNHLADILRGGTFHQRAPVRLLRFIFNFFTCDRSALTRPSCPSKPSPPPPRR
jgi:hypothetical protein